MHWRRREYSCQLVLALYPGWWIHKGNWFRVRVISLFSQRLCKTPNLLDFLGVLERFFRISIFPEFLTIRTIMHFLTVTETSWRSNSGKKSKIWWGCLCWIGTNYIISMIYCILRYTVNGTYFLFPEMHGKPRAYCTTLYQ